MRIDIHQEQTQVYLTNQSQIPDASLKTGDVLKSIVDYFKPWSETGVLLPRLVWINEDHSALVYERPPFVANIEYHHGAQGQSATLGVTNFSIPVPWTVWGIRFSTTGIGSPAEIRLFARNKPISSYQDNLYYLPVPNMDPGARCCTGGGFINVYSQPFLDRVKLASQAGTVANITIAERVNHILNLFWYGIFNQDYNWTEDYRLPAETPEHVRNEERIELRAMRFLEWWSNQDLKESVMNSYALANTFAKSDGDTVQSLIDDLDNHRKNQIDYLLDNNKLMRRILADIL